MTELLTFENLIAFLTLTGLEIVLGIDNIIFIAILAGRLPPEKRELGRKLGLLVAVISRVGLLLCIGWVMRLKEPLTTIAGFAFSGKDFILIGGGLFLLTKATFEIHHKVEGISEGEHVTNAGLGSSMRNVLLQVLAIDVVFSLDSVITAVGMTQVVPVMIAAVIAAVAVMLIFSGAIVRFIDRNPTVKILALSFLLLIGVLLVAEGFHQHIGRGYVYFAMAFSLLVESLQMMATRNEAKRAAKA